MVITGYGVDLVNGLAVRDQRILYTYALLEIDIVIELPGIVHHWLFFCLRLLLFIRARETIDGLWTACSRPFPKVRISPC
jgi:hypothetical protein